MKEISKRKPKKELRAGMLCALLAALALCAAGLLYALSRTEEAPPITESAQTAVVIASNDIKDIKRITVTPPSGETYALIVEDGKASVEGDPEFRVSETRVQGMLASAAHIEMNEALLDTAKEHVHLADFGLLPEKARAEVAYANGGTQTMLLGDAVPDEALTYYCMLSGDSRLFTVSGEVWDAFSTELLFLHEVPLFDVQPDLLSRVDITGESGFSLALWQDGWRQESPIVYPLSAQAMNALIARLEGMRLSSFVAYEKDADLSDYGLAPAARTLTLTFLPGVRTADDQSGTALTREMIAARTLTLGIGANASDTMLYCLYEGAVYKGTLFSMRFLQTLAADTLALRAPINFATNVMTEFAVQTGGKSAVYRLSLAERVLANNELETDEMGNVLYDVVVRKNGAPVDTDVFLQWYARFAGITGTGSVPSDYKQTGDPVATVTLKSEQATREVAFYAYDALNLALSVDGQTLYYTQYPEALRAAFP